jgi:hypothetical protein
MKKLIELLKVGELPNINQPIIKRILEAGVKNGRKRSVNHSA